MRGVMQRLEKDLVIGLNKALFVFIDAAYKKHCQHDKALYATSKPWTAVLSWVCVGKNVCKDEFQHVFDFFAGKIIQNRCFVSIHDVGKCLKDYNGDHDDGQDDGDFEGHEG